MDDHLLGYVTKLREKTLLLDAKFMQEKKKIKERQTMVWTPDFRQLRSVVGWKWV
jgi:hypothetical protein